MKVIRARTHLFLAFGFDVHLRVTGDGNAEVIAIVLANVFDKVHGIAKSILTFLPLVSTFWRV